MKNRCWSMTLLYKSRIIVWHRVPSLNNFPRCWKANTCSITKKGGPEQSQEKYPYLGECTWWGRNKHWLWHEANIMAQDASFPLPVFILSLKWTSSILMSLRAKIPLTPALVLCPFHSNSSSYKRRRKGREILSKTQRYQVVPSHLFTVSGNRWII